VGPNGLRRVRVRRSRLDRASNGSCEVDEEYNHIDGFVIVSCIKFQHDAEVQNHAGALELPRLYLPHRHHHRHSLVWTVRSPSQPLTS
jgi:hypothetical protein